MLWEQLVTEGHVRAARLRAAQPALISLAVLLCIIGGYGTLRINPPDAALNELSSSSETIQVQKQQINSFFSNLPDISLDANDTINLAPAYEIERTIKLITDSLNGNGKLPEVLPFQKLNKKEFWGMDWPAQNLHYYKKGKIILVGAVLSDERQISAIRQKRPAIRWVGVFRKDKGKWSAYSLRFPDAFILGGKADTIKPSDFPVTFSRLIPDAKSKP